MKFLPPHISESVLDDVAAQIGERIALVAPALRNVELELGETYSVWGLKKAAYLVPFKELEAQAFAAPTNSWHHQVKAADKAVAFAQSLWVPADKPKLSVSELVVGHVVRTVDDAFKWFWKTIPEEADARLLVVPSLYVHAFWLLDSDHPAGRVVIADAPHELTGLKKKELLSVQQFLDRVREYMQPAGGGGGDNPSLSEFGALLPYFRGCGMKILTATEVDPNTSHGQEIQGVAKLRELFGIPKEPLTLNAKVVYFNDKNREDPPAQTGTVTWYDARKGNPNRAPEYRLYYQSLVSLIQRFAEPGDSLIFTASATNTAFLIIADAKSEVERHLYWLFGIERTLFGGHDQRQIEATARLVLAVAGITV